MSKYLEMLMPMKPGENQFGKRILNSTLFWQDLVHEISVNKTKDWALVHERELLVF